MYLEEHYPDDVNVFGNRNYNPPNRGNQFKIKTEPYKGDWTEAGMFYHTDMVAGFGWAAYRIVFAGYVNGTGYTTPSTDIEKNDQYMLRFSRATGRNLADFHDSWSVPISNEARNLVSHLPKWLPESYVIDCNKVLYSGAPCASIEQENSQKGIDTSYQVRITTWSPVRAIYGERFVFTLSGAIPKGMTSNQTIPITLLGGNDYLNNTGTIVVLNDAVELTVFARKFIPSGTSIKFSFSATNNDNEGKLNIKVKHINNQGTLINVVERPLEVPVSITKLPTHPVNPSNSNNPENTLVSSSHKMAVVSVALMVLMIALL